MFLLIVIVILIAATSILTNIYMWIFSFQQNYGNLESYSNSHYAAISAIERWLLVSKYKKPSFIWSWWFIWTWNWWEVSELFSGDFWRFNNNNNWLHWTIASKCSRESSNLTNNNTLTFNTYTYDNTNRHYQTWSIISTQWISQWGGWELYGKFQNINSNINTKEWTVYRTINWDDKLWSYTWFVSSSWNTMINSWSINNNTNLIFNSSTINPTWTTNTWDTLCTQDGCYIWQTIWELIWGWNKDKWITIYIKDRLLNSTNNWQIWYIHYNLINDDDWNCQNYNIDWTATIWQYIQELSIQKPTFNYKNPNRKKFIFPHYN